MYDVETDNGYFTVNNKRFTRQGHICIIYFEAYFNKLTSGVTLNEFQLATLPDDLAPVKRQITNAACQHDVNTNFSGYLLSSVNVSKKLLFSTCGANGAYNTPIPYGSYGQILFVYTV